MNKRQARIEFEMLIERCACSRASLHISPEEAEQMNKDFEIDKYPQYKIEPVTPSCTPDKCFPELHKFLYLNGKCKMVSYCLKKVRKK